MFMGLKSNTLDKHAIKRKATKKCHILGLRKTNVN
jgi:hypothetical protein